MISVRAPLILLSALILACTSVRPATLPIDWSEVDDWSVHVVTADADGDLRVARIWLVVVDGTAAIRTQDSRWWVNIQRGSRTWIRRDGLDHAVDVEVVRDLAERARIDAAFMEKYGWQERLAITEERARTSDPYMRLTGKSN